MPVQTDAASGLGVDACSVCPDDGVARGAMCPVLSEALDDTEGLR